MSTPKWQWQQNSYKVYLSNSRSLRFIQVEDDRTWSKFIEKFLSYEQGYKACQKWLGEVYEVDEEESVSL